PEQHSRNRGDGRQRLAANRQRGDGKQIVGGLELARGVTFEGQQRVVVRHPVAVVDHADHALAADFHFDANRLRASIDGIFEQLFDDRSRPLDNFARGDFVRHRLRQYAYAAHDLAVLNAALQGVRRSWPVVFFSSGGRSFSSGVAIGLTWALAPEAGCKYLLGIGSRMKWPAAEEFGQSCDLSTKLARTGFIRM